MQQTDLNSRYPESNNSKGDLAVKYHNTGLNCAQSVLCACAASTMIDYDTAVSIASGFGGGLRCGEVCGATSGGVMTIGLYCGLKKASKDVVSRLTAEFMNSFKQTFGCVRCFDLKSNRIDCDTAIRTAAELTDKYIKRIEDML